MGRAKEIIVRVIDSKLGNDFIRKNHYSGKIVNNSQLHFGAFLENRLHGVMSFGCPLDKRKMLPLVKGTLWNEMLELNRMAFDDVLPKNSESRCISIAFKLIKKQAKHIKWILSFADGTQCGDGTIYRASGFVLTSIKKNSDLFIDDNNSVIHSMTLKSSKKEQSKNGNWKITLNKNFKNPKKIDGFQLRYIYFIHKQEIRNLTVPIIPFSEIEKRGAKMYKGIKTSDNDVSRSISDNHSESGGAVPTLSLSTI